MVHVRLISASAEYAFKHHHIGARRRSEAREQQGRAERDGQTIPTHETPLASTPVNYSKPILPSPLPLGNSSV
jgi:hypothetical protein